MSAPDVDKGWDDLSETVRDLAATCLEAEVQRRCGRPLGLDESFVRHWPADNYHGPDQLQHDLLVALAPRWVVDALLARLLELADAEVLAVASDAN